MRAESIQAYSERGWLLGTGDALRCAAILAALEKHPPPDLAEYVAGFETILLLFRNPVPEAEVAAWLASVPAEAGVMEEGIHHRIPVRYDGADLEEVARTIMATVDEVVALHSGPAYRVETMGFSPGFPYLGPLDPRLHLPRKATPRPQVPAGSVAIGGGHAGIYPSASAGGWHLLGTTGVPLFNPAAATSPGPEPRDVFTLAPGDRVTFVPVA